MSRLLAHCPASIQISCPKAPPPRTCERPSRCSAVDQRPSSECVYHSIFGKKKNEGKAPEQEFEDSGFGCFARGRGSRASREGLQRPDPPPRNLKQTPAQLLSRLGDFFWGEAWSFCSADYMVSEATEARRNFQQEETLSGSLLGWFLLLMKEEETFFFFFFSSGCVSLEVLCGTYCDRQQFGVREVSRDMVGFDPEGLPVPVACFLQPVQPQVGLS